MDKKVYTQNYETIFLIIILIFAASEKDTLANSSSEKNSQSDYLIGKS